MATINNIKKRAKEITNAFEPESVTAEKVGQLFEDIADVTEQVITSSEEVMQESVRASEQASQAAEDASGYLSDLQDAIQDLPDGQAVSAQVAVHTTQIAGLDTDTNIGTGENRVAPKDINRVEALDDRYLFAFTTSDNQLLLGIDKKTGNVYFGSGVPEQIRKAISDLADGIDSDLEDKVDTQEGKDLIDDYYSARIYSVEESSWIRVVIDINGRIINGAKKDGTTYIAKADIDVLQGKAWDSIVSAIEELSNYEDLEDRVSQVEDSVASLHNYDDTEVKGDIIQLKSDVSDLDSDFEQLVQNVNAALDEYAPIVINNNGTIANAADEEDLTESNNVLKLKDRLALYGYGYKILRRGVGLETQITEPNTIYEVRYDFDLSEYTQSNTFTFPTNTYLYFNGGHIIGAKRNKLSGRLLNEYVRPEWFGAKGDGVTFDNLAIHNCIEIAGTILFDGKCYRVSRSVEGSYDEVYAGYFKPKSNQTFDFENGAYISVGGYTAAEGQLTVFYPQNVENLTFKNLKIVGEVAPSQRNYGSTYSWAWDGCFKALGIKNLSFLGHTHIENTTSTFMSLLCCMNVTLEDFYGNQCNADGIYMRRCWNVKYGYISINHNWDDGISFGWECYLDDITTGAIDLTRANTVPLPSFMGGEVTSTTDAYERSCCKNVYVDKLVCSGVSQFYSASAGTSIAALYLGTVRNFHINSITAIDRECLRLVSGFPYGNNTYGCLGNEGIRIDYAESINSAQCDSIRSTSYNSIYKDCYRMGISIGTLVIRKNSASSLLALSNISTFANGYINIDKIIIVDNTEETAKIVVTKENFVNIDKVISMDGFSSIPDSFTISGNGSTFINAVDTANGRIVSNINNIWIN